MTNANAYPYKDLYKAVKFEIRAYGTEDFDLLRLVKSRNELELAFFSGDIKTKSHRNIIAMALDECDIVLADARVKVCFVENNKQ